MKKFFLIFLVILIKGALLNAQTDTTAVKDILDLSLEELLTLEISGVSRYKQKISDVPNSILLINQQQITERGYKDLSDLLKDIQGLDISSNAGRFGELYSLRGITGNDRFLILINGHKLNPASGTFISVGNSISIRYADRVEIIYGPASAIYGADAFSGIINIVFENISFARKDLEILAYSDYGSMNTLDAALGSSLRLTKDLSFNLQTRIYKSDGYDILGADPAYDIIADYTSPIKNKCEQPINDHTIYFNANYKNFSVNYYRQQFEEGNALGHNPAIYIFDKENKWKTTTDLIWMTYQKKFTNNGNLSVDLSLKNHIQDKKSVFKKWIVPGVVGDFFYQYMTGKDQTIHGLVTYNQIISEKFQYIVGIDNEYSTSIPPYANDQVLGNSFQYEGTNAKRIDDELTIGENRFSGFGQLIYTPFTILNLILGARYDYSSHYKGVLNPRAGFILSPAKYTRLKFIYGRAFLAPSLFYQYEQFGVPTAAMLSSAEYQLIDPAWKLKNQIVNSYEISITQNLGKNYQIKVGAYYNSLSNLIERKMYAVYPSDSVYNKYFNTYTSGLRNENIGEQKIIGSDFSLNAKITENLILNSYYSFTKAVSIQESGIETKVPRIAEHKLWISLTARNIFNYLTLAPRFRWSGDVYNLNTIDFPDHNQKGYYTVDLNVRISNFTRYMSLYANFDNILNQKIFHGGLYDQTGVYTSSIPQPGFLFRFGLEIHFKK